MRHLSVLIAVLALGLPSPETVAADGALAGVQFHGRWDRRDPGKAVTVNGGSHVVARFDGRSITARFNLTRNQAPLPTIAWRIDDDIEWRESEIAEAVELGKDLKPGEHTVMLIVRGLDETRPRWSEPLTASLTFVGFEFPTGGKLLELPEGPKLKVEFLGDSITEGVAVHRSQPGREARPWRTDALRAYASQTALRLEADWRQVGFGRLGVTIAGHGGVPPAADAFDWFYEGCPRDDWQADVVVVNQGTNDFRAPADQFRPAYARYLAVIRRAYPNATILALRPFNGAHADNIGEEVAVRRKSGDTNVHYIDTTGWVDPATDYTDRVHPNAAAGPKIAAKLAPIIAGHAKPAN